MNIKIFLKNLIWINFYNFKINIFYKKFETFFLEHFKLIIFNKLFYFTIYNFKYKTIKFIKKLKLI